VNDMRLTFEDFLGESPTAMAKLAALKAKRQPVKKEQPISHADLDKLESHLDKLFKGLNIDIEFSKHFFDRLSDARNGKMIKLSELNDIFTKAHAKYGKSISTKRDGWQAVINSLSSSLNIPFVVNLKRNGMLEVVGKTIMRKKDFKTPNQKLKVA